MKKEQKESYPNFNELTEEEFRDFLSTKQGYKMVHEIGEMYAEKIGIKFKKK